MQMMLIGEIKEEGNPSNTVWTSFTMIYDYCYGFPLHSYFGYDFCVWKKKPRNAKVF